MMRKLFIFGLTMLAAAALCFDAGPLLAIVGAEKSRQMSGRLQLRF